MIRRNKIDTVFALTIFCFFAVSVLLVIMFAASTYSNMTDISQNRQNERILLSYIRTKIRSADNPIYVSEFHGISALFIEEYLDERELVTIIYNHDGIVRELFCEKDSGLLPEDGVAIIAVDFLGFSVENDMLICVSTDISDFFIMPRIGVIRLVSEVSEDSL